MSSKPTEPYYTTEGGIKLYENSYWVWRVIDEAPWYFRFTGIMDSAGGLHATILDKNGYITMQLSMFDSPQIQEVTDEDEIAMIMLSLV